RSLTYSSSFTSFFFQLSAATHTLPSFPTRRSSDLYLRRPDCSARHQRPDSPLKQAQSGGWPLHALRQTRKADQPHHDRRGRAARSEEHTSELQSQSNLVCRLLLEKKKKKKK